MDDDMVLVREYASRQSEPAFDTLVSRHVSLVHSAALRQVRDPHLAAEITQDRFYYSGAQGGGTQSEDHSAGLALPNHSLRGHGRAKNPTPPRAARNRRPTCKP